MPEDVSPRGFRVAGLGEVAVRCRDLAAMERFYADAIGLEVLGRRDRGIVFFRLAEGYRGHTAVLALFDDGATPATGEASWLHYVALSIGWDEQAAAVRWLESRGLPVRVETFDWIGWRGVFTADPEGNTVELVAARPPANA
jgi:catechol-2,3-dioxygenase